MQALKSLAIRLQYIKNQLTIVMKQIGLKPDEIWNEAIEMYTTFALKSFRDEERVIPSAFLFPQTRPKWPIKIINGLVQGVLGKNQINQYGFVYSKSGIIFGIEDCNNLNFIFPPKSIQLLLSQIEAEVDKNLDHLNQEFQNFENQKVPKSMIVHLKAQAEFHGLPRTRVTRWK